MGLRAPLIIAATATSIPRRLHQAFCVFSRPRVRFAAHPVRRPRSVGHRYRQLSRWRARDRAPLAESGRRDGRARRRRGRRRASGRLRSHGETSSVRRRVASVGGPDVSSRVVRDGPALDPRRPMPRVLRRARHALRGAVVGLGGPRAASATRPSRGPRRGECRPERFRRRAVARAARILHARVVRAVRDSRVRARRWTGGTPPRRPRRRRKSTTRQSSRLCSANATTRGSKAKPTLWSRVSARAKPSARKEPTLVLWMSRVVTRTPRCKTAPRGSTRRCTRRSRSCRGTPWNRPPPTPCEKPRRISPSPRAPRGSARRSRRSKAKARTEAKAKTKAKAKQTRLID